MNNSVNLLKTHENHNNNIEDLNEAFNSFFYVPDSRHANNLQNISDLELSNVKARVCNLYFINSKKKKMIL